MVFWNRHYIRKVILTLAILYTKVQIIKRYLYGINLGLDWKGIDISAFLQGVGKWDCINGTYAGGGEVGNSHLNISITTHGVLIVRMQNILV